MKLATLRNGTRDGRLVVVSRDLARAVDAAPVVSSLRQAIERWDEVHAALESLSAALNAMAAPMAFAFDPAAAMAPLPRTHQFVDASAFLNHGQIMEQAYNLDVNGQAVTLATPLASSGGRLTLLDSAGGGTLILTAANTYTGNTTLSNGTVNLGVAENAGVSGPLGTQAANASGTILMAGGTMQFTAVNQNDYSGRFGSAGNQAFNLDVNGQAVTFATALTSSGGSLTLSDSTGGGSLTLSAAGAYTGNTTVQGGTLALNYATLATNSTVSVRNGVLKLNFSVTNKVGALVLNGVGKGPGVYNSANSAPYLSGSGSLLVPVTGPGIFTNSTGITGFSLNGANVVINATNGQAGDAYYLLTSTNLTQPVSQWKPVATNVPGSSGNYMFTATNAVIPGAEQQFFRLSNTNN